MTQPVAAGKPPNRNPVRPSGRTSRRPDRGSSPTSSTSSSSSSSSRSWAILSIVFAAIFFPLAIITSLAIIVVSVGYFPYFWARTGQTPGMSAMKIKVVRDADGGPLTAGQAILRLIGLWIGLAVFYIGVIWIFVDKRKRGWQDLIGGTVVIEQPATVYTS